MTPSSTTTLDLARGRPPTGFESPGAHPRPILRRRRYSATIPASECRSQAVARLRRPEPSRRRTACGNQPRTTPAADDRGRGPQAPGGRGGVRGLQLLGGPAVPISRVSSSTPTTALPRLVPTTPDAARRVRAIQPMQPRLSTQRGLHMLGMTCPVGLSRATSASPCRTAPDPALRRFDQDRDRGAVVVQVHPRREALPAVPHLRGLDANGRLARGRRNCTFGGAGGACSDASVIVTRRASLLPRPWRARRRPFLEFPGSEFTPLLRSLAPGCARATYCPNGHGATTGMTDTTPTPSPEPSCRSVRMRSFVRSRRGMPGWRAALVAGGAGGGVLGRAHRVSCGPTDQGGAPPLER